MANSLENLQFVDPTPGHPFSGKTGQGFLKMTITMTMDRVFQIYLQEARLWRMTPTSAHLRLTIPTPRMSKRSLASVKLQNWGLNLGFSG